MTAVFLKSVYHNPAQMHKRLATSKNSILMIWTEDIATEKVLEKTEYFVYCGFFKMNFWGDRFVQIAKGEFLEVPDL